MSLDAIGIVSKDMRASVNFYKILDVHLEEAGGSEHLQGATPSGVRIMLDSVNLMKTLNPDWREPYGSGVILCFKQESPEKVNEIFSKVVEAGFKGLKEPWDAFWGQRYASVCDPDGNQIDIFAPVVSKKDLT